MARNNSVSADVRHARRGTKTALHPVPNDLKPSKVGGLRERKKVRLRTQIIETSLRLFCERGYEGTRIDDIVATLEISQPTFFRYFPSKDAVLRDVGRLRYDRIKKHLEDELSSNASTAERLREMYQTMAEEVEADRPLWRAMVLSGAMDPVHSPEMRQPGEVALGLLREIIVEGQKRGEITASFSSVELAKFMQALYTAVVRSWVTDLKPYSLTKRVRNAVRFFLCATEKSPSRKWLVRSTSRQSRGLSTLASSPLSEKVV
jgi:AcrR family transcriptional regulator